MSKMNDVAIIGVGLHPFGRFEGKSAMEMGVDAIVAAVADAGVQWKDLMGIDQRAVDREWSDRGRLVTGPPAGEHNENLGCLSIPNCRSCPSRLVRSPLALMGCRATEHWSIRSPLGVLRLEQVSPHRPGRGRLDHFRWGRLG